MPVELVVNELGFIGVFLVATAIMYMMLGPQFTFYFLVLVLLGQVVVNWDIFDSLIKGAMPQ